MSQSVQEFVRRSGVELQSPNSASNSNNSFVRELERDVAMIQERKARENRIAQGQRFFRTPTRPLPRQAQFPPNLQKNIVNNNTYGRFKKFENSPLANEFDDVILNSNNEKMINNLLAEQGMLNNGPEINTNLLANDNFAKGFGNNLNYIAPPPPTELQVSKLNVGMYNGLINGNFGQKNVRMDLKPLLLKTPRGRTAIGEGLYVDTIEIVGYYGQMQAGLRHTRELGPKGDINKVYNKVQFKFQITNDIETKGGTLDFYRNGKIRFSAGFVGSNIANQPELLRRFVITSYTEGQSFLYSPFEYNNLSGQFRINGVFKNLTNIARDYKQYGMTYATYEPELTPFLYIDTMDYKFSLTRNGNIQIIGAKDPKTLQSAYEFGTRFVKQLDRNGEIEVTGEFSEGLKKTTKAKAKAKPKPKPKAKAKAKTKPKTKTNVKNTPNKLTKNQLNAVNVDMAACKRMKRDELVEFAKKLGIVQFRVKTSDGSRQMRKDEICEKIKAKKGVRTVTYKNTRGKNINLKRGANGRFKIGRKSCLGMKVKELTDIAKLLKIPLTGKEKKADLCKLIEKARNNIANKPVPKKLSPGALKQKAKNNKRAAKELEKNVNRQLKVNNVEMKRRLNENSIRNDLNKLYGKVWMKRYKPNLNQDVKIIQNRISNIRKTNKLGVPFKRDIDELKKRLVAQWKRERVRDLEKKLVNTNGVSNNMKNRFRLAAVNYIMNLKNQKKTITAARLAQFKKNWLKRIANITNNGRPKGINRAVKARIETL